MTQGYAGKVAIVTGGGRGIGRATALLMAREGARVVICSRSQAELDEVAAQSEAVSTLCGSVADETFVERLFTEAARITGRVDVLVNNAATLGRRLFAELEPSLWDEVLGVNLRGAYLCSRAAFKQMAAQSPMGGTIVNLSSLSGIHGPEKFPGLVAYNVSKAGVLSLTDSLAVEGKPYGIRVNTVGPGAVDTAMLREAGHGLKAGATPEDIARSIVFLASDASHPMTGANVEILSNA